MRYLIIISLSSILFACSNDTDEVLDIMGKWQLKEQLSDPGDGSGEFVEVPSAKEITFNSDGTFSSNGTLCTMNLFANEQTSGSYSSNDRILIPDDCPNFNTTIEFVITNEDELILSYTCIEPCQQKYKRIE